MFAGKLAIAFITCTQ